MMTIPRNTQWKSALGVRPVDGHRSSPFPVERTLGRRALSAAPDGTMPRCSVFLTGAALVLVLLGAGASAVGAPEAGTGSTRTLDAPAGPESANGSGLPVRVVSNGIGFLRGLVGAAAEQPRFLALDEAFRLSVQAEGPDRLVANWDIAPEYYLYRDRIQVEMADGQSTGTLVKAVQLPPGAVRDDPYFGTVEIYRTEAQGRFVVLDFYADWCVSCRVMEETTFRDARVRTALQGSMALSADVTEYDEADRVLMGQLGVLGPPAILFFTPDRSERRRYRLVGFEDADEFARRLTGVFDAA